VDATAQAGWAEPGIESATPKLCSKTSIPCL
jgi:hypothetical protein